MAGKGRGEDGQGRAGQGRAGQGRAGQGRAGQGRAGQEIKRCRREMRLWGGQKKNEDQREGKEAR